MDQMHLSCSCFQRSGFATHGHGKQINQNHGKVALCSLNGYVREIFEGNCFHDTFAIADSVESGIQILQGTLNAA